MFIAKADRANLVSKVGEENLKKLSEILLQLVDPGQTVGNQKLVPLFIIKGLTDLGVSLDKTDFWVIRNTLIKDGVLEPRTGRGGGTFRPLSKEPIIVVDPSKSEPESEKPSIVEEPIKPEPEPEEPRPEIAPIRPLKGLPTKEDEEQYRRRRCLENLSAYLGNLFVGCDREHQAYFRKIIPPELCTIYLKGTNIPLRMCASFLLVMQGKMWVYRYQTVDELIDLYLGKDRYGDLEGNPDRKSYLDVSTPVLISHHLKHTVQNRKTESLISSLVYARYNEGLITVVLDELNLEEVREMMRELRLPVIEKNLVPKSIPNSGSTVPFSTEIKSPI